MYFRNNQWNTAAKGTVQIISEKEPSVPYK